MHPLNRISISKLVLKALSVLFFLGTAFTCVSQNSYDHWAFGSGMHIDFTSGTPTISCNTSINSQEASAVWSNPVTGAFLAYTDGNTVYNGQTNATLSNGTGLTANSSSIESALILPKPGQTLNDIYIFHNNITNTYWSEADLSSGTNGTVTSKNNFLQASGSERCGTAPHGNICPAYWVMISKGMNDSVAVYLVDTNGISATPVVTSTGISGGSARGNIVFSEDCTKIGMSVESKGMYVANFNANTGATSGWTKIGNTTNGFGSAFSPDGTKIYYTSAYGGTLYQYNFSNSTQTALGGSSLSYLALAPDGQIYISKYGSASLGVISSPNAAGTACGFNVSGLTWSLGSSCLCRWGLPNPFHVDIGYHPVAPDTIVLCPGEDTLFTTQVTGDTFNWNTGATTQSVLLDSAGLYYCTIGFGDCASSDSVYLIYLDDVEISGNDVCQSDTTFFTHTTLMPASNIQGYLWDFGDGNTGASANPFHIYSYGDTFDVTLTLTTNSGCELDTSMTVIVHPKPVPAFSFENVCDGSAVQFQSNATEGSASIVSHSWDVTNNGTTDFANLNPQFQYSTFGQYAVEYKVEDALGCKDSLVKPLFVHPIPVADFGVENECFNVAQAFFDSSTVAVGNIANWNWAFGDGATSTLAGPTHLYNAPGTYTVNLTIESDSGCFDSKSMNTVVYFLPIADFYADSVCENVAAAFNSASSAQSGNISQYGWEFGDGVDAAVSSVLHDYDNPGLFDVMHTVVSNYGCVDTIWKPIRIYPAPVTAFRWKNNVCQGDDLPFYDQSMLVQITPGGDEIANWEWILMVTHFLSNKTPRIKRKHTKVLR
jgi:PKD repeat protein